MTPVINFSSGIDAPLFEYSFKVKLLYFIIISVGYQINFSVANTATLTTQELRKLTITRNSPI